MSFLDDSWLESEKPKVSSHPDHDDSAVSMGERIYSGRESPVKGVGTKEETRVIASAGTTDSFDYAFQREAPSANNQETTNQYREGSQDNFFDSWKSINNLFEIFNNYDMQYFLCTLHVLIL